LTKKLQELLEMLDVRLLDHFIVAGTETVSMAEAGAGVMLKVTWFNVRYCGLRA
jgi:hypothetical protein